MVPVLVNSGVTFASQTWSTSVQVMCLIGVKLSPEPMLAHYCWLDPWVQITVKLYWKYNDFHLQNFFFFKYCLENTRCHNLNTLAPGVCDSNFKSMIFRRITQNSSLSILWHVALMWVNIGSGNGLLLPGDKPLPKPMLTKIYMPDSIARPQWFKKKTPCNMKELLFWPCILFNNKRVSHEKKIGHRDCSLWVHGDQNGHSQPWPGPLLSCDLALTELWSYWRCHDWAVTSPWLSCDLAVTELWPLLAVTEPWSLGPGAMTTGHHLFSHGLTCGMERSLRTYVCSGLNTLRLKQNGHRFANIFKLIFFIENCWIFIHILLKFVLKGSISNVPALVHIMAWCQTVGKPLSETLMAELTGILYHTRVIN